MTKIKNREYSDVSFFISGETGIRIERLSMIEKEIEKDEIIEDTFGKPAWLCFILQKKNNII